MSIDWSRLRGITARELTRALVRDGFNLRRQTGSHQHYRHPDGRKVMVAFHRSGETFPMDTLRKMIRGARWTTNDLTRLGLY